MNNEDKIAELIRQAQEIVDNEEEPKKERVSRYVRGIKRFIQDKGIVHGEVKVPVYRLVHEYFKWDGAQGRKASPRELGRVFSVYFKKHKTGKYRYYLLNEFCDMSKDAMKESKEYYKKYFLKRARKDEKPNKEEVHQSEPESGVKT